MGIYGALSSAVTGLRAQAHALENISGNIANSQTTGYKRIETEFLDLIPDAPLRRQVPGAVLAQSRSTNDVQGDIKTVSNETYIALNAQGFFVVEPKIGQSDGNTVFAGTNFFTRRGDFEIDKDGYMVNGAGYYLKGLPIDPATGNISGSVPEPIRISNAFLEAQQTNRINYQTNLPQMPKTGAYKPGEFNSELMQPRNYAGSVWSPATVTGTAALNPVYSAATVAGNRPTDLATTDLAGSYFTNTSTLTFGAAGANSVTLTFNNTLPATATNLHIDPATTQLGALMTSIQSAVRNAGGGLATANVALVDGQMSVDLGTNTVNDLTLGGETTTLNALGMTAGTTARNASTAASNYFTAGESITLNINGTETTYEFYDTASYTGTNRGVDISGNLATALGNLEASIRANGGPSAATAVVQLTSPGNRLNITLGNDSYATFSIEEGEGSLGLTAGQTVTGPVRPIVESVAASQNALFLSNSISGGAVTVYAENGAPANVQLRWAKVSSEQAGGTDTWNLYYMSDSRATGGAEMWHRVPTNFTFDGDGSLVSPTDPSITLDDLQINGVLVGDVEMRYDTSGLTQFADVNGTANVSTLNQNGFGAGEFVSVAINDNGRVVATYSNGERIDMAQVVTAQFNATNQLKRMDGGVFANTSESGDAILDLTGTGIIGGAVEASNTDISDEFTKLIVTQQAYAAGTRIVSTADEMLQEALNMVR
jgi:flagellar hook protein FlgE